MSKYILKKRIAKNTIPPESIYGTYPVSAELVNDMPLITDILARRPDIYQPDTSGIPPLLDPATLKYYDAATKIVLKAIEDKLPIVVAMDYDCDGQTAGCSMVYTLGKCGANITYVVPSRLEEGYGLNAKLVEAKVSAPALVITVDNGITSVEATEELVKKGYSVLITDHHLQEGELPKQALHILDPKICMQPDEAEYMAPGVYVSAKLSLNVAKQLLDKEDFLNVLAYCNSLVGLGIVSDVIELNRCMRNQLAYSLAELNDCKFVGILALLKMCGVKPNQNIVANFIAFSIAPKLNAAGRMGVPQEAIDLLLMTENTEEIRFNAFRKANQLKYLNSDRKLIEQRIYDEAVTVADNEKLFSPHGLVVYRANWHLGVLGIIAARLVEKYHVPVIVLSDHDGSLEGSGRSIAGLDLFTCIQNCKEHLLHFGGHNAAAGVALEPSKLEAFKIAFEKEITNCQVDMEPTYEIDGVVSIRQLNDIRWQLFLSNLEPHGNLNPSVNLLLGPVVVKTSEVKRDALNLVVSDNEDYTIVLSKYHAPEAWNKLKYKTIKVVVTPSVLYFSGTTNVEYRIVEIYEL